jgi:hypothetical protein
MICELIYLLKPFFNLNVSSVALLLDLQVFLPLMPK